MNKKVICQNVLGEKFEVPVSELSFRPAAYGIIIQDDKLLLSPQWEGYDLPGGGIELGETIKETLVREVKEETGFDVAPISLVDSQSNFFKFRTREEYVQTVSLYYLCKITGGELSGKYLTESEKSFAKMPEWIDLAKLDKINFCSTADVRKVIKTALITAGK